jgi:hypothetical protein
LALSCRKRKSCRLIAREKSGGGEGLGEFVVPEEQEIKNSRPKRSRFPIDRMPGPLN